MCFIQTQVQESGKQIHKKDQVESYFFWQTMELFCCRNREVMMCEFTTVIFQGYSRLKKNPQQRSAG